MIQVPELEALLSTPFARLGDLPEEPGIYFALAENGEVLYIGQTKNLAVRWQSHHRSRQLGEMGCVSLAWLAVNDLNLLTDIEQAMIRHFQPCLNGSPEGIDPFSVSFKKGSLDWFWNQVRRRMKEQARGYQTRIAAELGVDRSYINRFIKGEHELAPKYQQPVLDSLGIEIDLKPKDGD